MSEDRILSDSVRLFSERCPDNRGQLFHVSNERNNSLQAMKAKSKGIFNGVSDLLFLSYKIVVGIELKAPESYHKREHIESQIEWAKILESQGGVWRLCTNAEDVFSCTQFDFKGMTIAEVELMLKTQKNKNIKF